MNNPKEEIPCAWDKFDLPLLSGVLMVVGQPDVGKSTFSRYLFRRLCAVYPCVAYLDGDPGQSTLGPPTTLTLALSKNGDDAFPPQGRIWRGFVGSVSPTGHMLPLLTAAARLSDAARQAGAQAVIYDTSGLVDPVHGGSNLKVAKIDLLRPKFLFTIQHDQELESLLAPMRRRRSLNVVELSPSPEVRRRDASTRRAHRAEQFARYFANADRLRLNWTQFAVLPAPRFRLHRLVAMEDGDGFTSGLGIVEQIDRIRRQVVLRSPLQTTNQIDTIRLGNLAVDPKTFEDRQLTCM